MSWTPITGKADYASGFSNATTITPDAGENGKTVTYMIDPFLNLSGTQDYGDYSQGMGSKNPTADPGNRGLTAPTKGGKPGGIYE